MKIKPIKITVNGKQFTVWDNHISVVKIASLAGISMNDYWMKLHGNMWIFITDGSSFTVDSDNFTAHGELIMKRNDSIFFRSTWPDQFA